MTDDQGWGDFGCHGNPHLRTPNLDRFATQSVEFTHFHTSPVCTPTRASLMTGRYNYRTCAIDTYIGRAMMHPDEVTLAEMLGAAGYRTGIFGKWHLGDNYPMRPNDQGFHESLVHKGGGLAQPSDHPENPGYFDPYLVRDGREEKCSGYCTDVFTDAAIRFIEANRARPFFCYLALNAPHTPLEIADKYVEPYRAMGLDETTAKVYGMVANIDENLGRLFARLDDSRLARDTIVIFMTDNGPQQTRYNGGMRGAKGTVYDGGIRVPFFIRWPEKFEAGKKVDRIAAHIDVAPTLLEACGVKPPAEVAFDGKSLMPLLRDESPEWPDRALFFQWHRGDEPVAHKSAAVRTDRYKLVNGRELYDMLDDPTEKNDLAAGHPEIVADLRKRYEAWFRDVSSTRGYAPPRIQIGTPHENPTVLTRQDWRGPQAGWAADSLGHWEVEVARAGQYEVRLLFGKVAEPTRATFRFGAVEQSAALNPGDASCILRATLPAAPGRVEAWTESNSKPVGVHYVYIKRLGS